MINTHNHQLNVEYALRLFNTIKDPEGLENMRVRTEAMKALPAKGWGKGTVCQPGKVELHSVWQSSSRSLIQPSFLL